eukprot:5611255-Amphidinium_carterae.1
MCRRFALGVARVKRRQMETVRSYPATSASASSSSAAPAPGVPEARAVPPAPAAAPEQPLTHATANCKACRGRNPMHDDRHTR